MTHDDFTETAIDIPQRMYSALDSLRVATEYAEQLATDRWEFAVEISQLSSLGLSPNDFRWLVRSGLVEHRREVTLEGDDGRQFRTAGKLIYCDCSCFVLTELGVQLAAQLQQAGSTAAMEIEYHGTRVERAWGYFGWQHVNGQQQANGQGHANGQRLPGGEIPSWDGERRELRFNGILVKHFKWLAFNQQAILCAFEEDGWPPRIDDPLPPHEEQDSKRRLADTIKCLNRKQSHAVLHFRGDGTGEGVIWEIISRGSEVSTAVR